MPIAHENELAPSDVLEMTRGQIIQALLEFDGRVRMDFTEDFLKQKSTDWLRHVLYAACECCC